MKLEKRTRKFTVDILRLSGKLGSQPEQLVIRRQLSKSGSSVGANYREANRSRSKRDFKNKIRISLSEASEPGYWLEIVEDMKWIESKELNECSKEAKELLAIFTSIVNKL